jgi:DNA-binding response OmpR family regulator
MGGMPGVEALRPIKALARATRVIMLTSCCDSETEARAFRDGASDFLSKNCGVIEIAMRIRLAWSNPEIPPVFEDSREEVLETPGCGAIERENKPRFSGAGRAVRTAKKYYWQVETRLWFGMSRIHAVLSRLGAGSIWWTDQDSELGNDVKSEV